MTDQLVSLQVMVRESDVPKVYAFLHGLQEGAGLGEEDGDAEDWSTADLRELASSPQESLQRVVKVMDVLAAAPAQRFALSELAVSVGHTTGELKGALGGLTRWINKRWGGGEKPFQVVWGKATAAGQDGEAYYGLDEETAARWNRVRKARSS